MRGADDCLAMAWARYDDGQFDDAIRTARQACAEAPDRPDCQAALGWFLLERGSPHDAEQLLRSALVRSPAFAPLHWYLGLACFRDRRNDEASVALATAVRLDPALDEAAATLAWVLGDLGRFAEAVAYVRHALSIRTSPERVAQLGWLLFQAGSYAEAVAPLQETLALAPERAEIRYHLSLALKRLGRREEALDLLSAGLALSPDAAGLPALKIGILLDLRRAMEARKLVHRWIRLRPDDASNWLLLSQVLVQREQRHIAARALARARRLAPERPELWRQAGWLEMETGDLRAARKSLERLLMLAAEDPASDVLAAFILDASGDLQSAARHAESAVAKAGNTADAWRALAQVRYRQDRLREAEAALRTALDLDPGKASNTHRLLGWVYLADDRHEDAAKAFGAATESDPYDAWNWYGLAEAHRGAGTLLAALHAIKNALRLRKNWPEGLGLRGRIVEKQIYRLVTRNWQSLHAAPQEPAAPAPGGPAAEGAQYAFVLCSLCTTSHLSLARTLIASVRQHFSGKIHLLLIDSDDASLIPADTTLVRRDQVIDPAVWQEMVARYNTLELCCTLKALLLRFLARTAGCPVIYLDADTYLLAPLGPVLPPHPDFSVFLTPHLTAPLPGDYHANEIGMLCAGTYNAGVVGVGTNPDGIRFLDWWAERVRLYAYEAQAQGVFTDQRWLDLVPSFFRQVCVSQESGLNVGHWRVCSERDFAEDPAGRLTFRGGAVTLMHMSQFVPERPHLLARYVTPAVTQDLPLARFLRKYAGEIIRNR